MKVLSKVLEAIGFTSLIFGGCGMDNPSIIVPLIIALAGIGIMTVGVRIEYEYT